MSFETAIRVFTNPFALTEQDRVEDGEYRWQTTGVVEGFLVLLVAHADRAEDGMDVIRIISAPRATTTEKNVMRKIVRHKFDPTNPHPLTKLRRRKSHR
ncbi:BrnT family toxin [Mesorhizobium sp. B2-3-11]|uniref:BrnT family toxin n=1 Tax=Mesorhizobium sp. B2-3-11 TaxID=2589953 RepID=UPI0032B2AF0E